MTIALRLFALVSVLASLLCYGLSGMAADDVSRLPQAHRVQALQLLWLAASIITPFVAAIVGRRGKSAEHWSYVPLVVIGLIAFSALASF